ncbi:unnamed protein product, partial [Chrysoparadoxa australica]
MNVRVRWHSGEEWDSEHGSAPKLLDAFTHKPAMKKWLSDNGDTAATEKDLHLRTMLVECWSSDGTVKVDALRRVVTYLGPKVTPGELHAMARHLTLKGESAPPELRKKLKPIGLLMSLAHAKLISAKLNDSTGISPAEFGAVLVTIAGIGCQQGMN